MKKNKTLWLFLAMLCMSEFLTTRLYAYPDGSIAGRTKLTSTAGCGSCHGSAVNAAVQALISGPSAVPSGQTATFTITVTFTGHSGSTAGVDIAVRNGTLSPISTQLQLNGTELTQNNNPLTLGTAYSFRYTAPASGVSDTIYAVVAGNKVSGGSWNHAAHTPVVLPVQLSSFSGSAINPNSVCLDWRTISEVNNYGFFVQRRAPSEQSFAELANNFVPGHGTTNVPQHYTFTDNTGGGRSHFYRLKQIDLDGSIYFTDPIQVNLPTGTDESSLPMMFNLKQNFPNPFNPTTTIAYGLSVDAIVNLAVYNSLGQKVAQLVDGPEGAGYHTVVFDASQLASGVYVYRLKAGDKFAARELVLLR